MVDIVLCTDMSQHFQQMSQISDALNNPKELDKVKDVISLWFMMIIIGAVLAMIREIITNYASEQLGFELR